MKMYLAIAVLPAVFWACPGRTQEAVWDPVEIAKFSEEAAQMSEVILATVDLLNQVNAVIGSVGRFGALSTLDVPGFDAASALAGLPPTTVGASLPASTVRKTAAQDGYALAMHIRQSLTDAPVNSKILAAAAAASSDLRGDVAADTAAAVAGLNQLIRLQAVLASLLEIRASEQLRASRPPAGAVQQGNQQP